MSEQEPLILDINLPAKFSELKQLIEQGSEIYQEAIAKGVSPDTLPPDELPQFTLNHVFFALQENLEEEIAGEFVEDQDVIETEEPSLDFDLDPEILKTLKNLLSELTDHYLKQQQDVSILTAGQVEKLMDQVIDIFRAYDPRLKIEETREEMLQVLTTASKDAISLQINSLLTMSIVNEEEGRVRWAIMNVYEVIALDPTKLEELSPRLQELLAKIGEDTDEVAKDLAQMNREDAERLEFFKPMTPLKLVKNEPDEEG